MIEELQEVIVRPFLIISYRCFKDVIETHLSNLLIVLKTLAVLKWCMAAFMNIGTSISNLFITRASSGAVAHLKELSS